MAVLPTPGSPTSTGLFFRRRQSTWIIRSTSAARPTSGSMSPFAARSTRFTVYVRNGSFAGRSLRPPIASSPSSPSSVEGPSSPSFVVPCETNWRMSIRWIPCASRRWTACEPFSRVMATRTSPACSSVRPLPCTCQAARWRTRWNAAVCSGSRSVASAWMARSKYSSISFRSRSEIGAAGQEDLLRDPVVGQREQEVLQGDVLVVAAARVRQGRLEGLLQLFGNGHHVHSGSIVIRSGYSRSRARAVALAAFVSAISQG